MSLFQEWKAKLWEEFWAVKVPATWGERAKLGGFFAGAAAVGFSIGSGIQKFLPTHSERIVTGGGVLALGMIVYPYVDYWNRFKQFKLANRSTDLMRLCDTFLQEGISEQMFLDQVSAILDARFDDGPEKGLRALYVYLKQHPSDLLAEKLFDPLFTYQDPRMVSIELDMALDPTGTLGLKQSCYCTLSLGIQIRYQEFLAKRVSHCDLYRQDLMAAAWHPKRVESWIRQDRWDLLID